jgi:hypothetical protein
MESEGGEERGDAVCGGRGLGVDVGGKLGGWPLCFIFYFFGFFGVPPHRCFSSSSLQGVFTLTTHEFELSSIW